LYFLSNARPDIWKESTPKCGQIFEANVPTCYGTNLTLADACCSQ